MEDKIIKHCSLTQPDSLFTNIFIIKTRKDKIVNKKDDDRTKQNSNNTGGILPDKLL